MHDVPLYHLLEVDQELGGAVPWKSLAMRHPKLVFDRLEYRFKQSQKLAGMAEGFFTSEIDRNWAQVLCEMKNALPVLARNDSHRFTNLLTKCDIPCDVKMVCLQNALQLIVALVRQLRRADPDVLLTLFVKLNLRLESGIKQFACVEDNDDR